LSEQSVLLECADLAVSSPSFLDEVVKEVLVARGARELRAMRTSRRVGELLHRAATNRGVHDRLVVILRDEAL